MEAGQVEAKEEKTESGGYVVLRQDGQGWFAVEGATRQEAAEINGEGVYVQIPKRSWKPATAGTKTETKVVWT